MGYMHESKTWPMVRIELSNPGSLLVSRVQLLQGGVSECRNKSLQLISREQFAIAHVALGALDPAR